MESGNPPNVMDATRHHSLASIGVRNHETNDERVERRVEDDQREERDAEAMLRAPPRLKLRGKDVSLDEHIKEMRDKYARDFAPVTAVVRDLNYSVELRRRGGISTMANLFSKPPPKTEVKILQNMTFALRPGEMTVLLGASKSGKSSLLDIIACRRAGSISGVLSINGVSPAQTPLAYHTFVGYVQQGDLHMSYLTVDESFRFSAFLRMPASFPKEAREDRVEAVLQLLGLESARDTLIGDEFQRGVSGGEKRRVTVGTEWVKGARIMLLDEPTTGLDAAAALNIGRALRTISSTGVPVLCAMLQPGNELLSLFDKVLIMTRGQVAYWGPLPEAMAYFERLGFRCPSEYSEAEFLASVVERPADFLADEEAQRNIRTPEAIVEVWHDSEMRQRMEHELQPVAGQDLTTFNLKKLPVEYPVSLWVQLYWLMWRGVKKLARNWRRELLDLSVNIAFALIIGFFFYRRAYRQVDLRARLAVLFYAIIRLAFNSLAVIPTLYIERAVFYRQVAARYYSEIPYALQNVLLNIPLGIIDVVSFSAIVYWVANLYPNAWRFLYFCLMLFVLRQTMNAFALLLSATIPVPIVATLAASAISVVFILFSGFLITRTRIISFWKFGPYISPIHYVFDALALNELYGTRFTCTTGELVPPPTVANFDAPYPIGFAGSQICPYTSGREYLAAESLSTHWWHRWGNFAVIVGFWLGFSALLVLALRYLSFAAHVEPTGKEDVSSRLDRVKKSAEAAPELRHEGATLVWENLNYRVPQRLLLNDVNGFVRPGMLLALMGASGAGKTTLLDVLANRKNVGNMEGTILLNGTKPDATFHRYISYVEQNDIHLPSQTVLEAVSFAARSRLPKTMDEHGRAAIVQRVLHLLDLTDIAGQQVGLVGGLNPEQRKRLTIAVELAANPQILFLDEPTSGLDAAGANRVMTAVAEVAKAGTSVICTIHQPSSRIFALCTHLLLLQAGGEVMYFGPIGENFTDVVGYFERTFHKHLPHKANPADFVLNMSRVIEGERSPAEVWRDTDEAKRHLEELHKAKQDHGGEKFTKRYPLSIWQQIGLSLTRNWLGMWRNPFGTTVDFLRSLLLGVVFGTVFWFRPMDQLGVNELFGAIFFSAVFANLSSFSYLPAVYFARPLFARERAEGFYRVSAYAIGLFGANIPFLALNVALFSGPFYWLSGLKRTAGGFFFYLLVVFELTLVAVAFAHAVRPAGVASSLTSQVAVWSPTPVTAGIVFSSTFAAFALVAGFLLSYSQQPKYLGWAYWISFFHWFLEPISISNFEGRAVHCSASQYTHIPIALPGGATAVQLYCPITSGNQLLASLDIVIQRKWVGVGVLAGLWLGFVVITMIGLRVLKPVKR